jgi:GAF domain-containing protein
MSRGVLGLESTKLLPRSGYMRGRRRHAEAISDLRIETRPARAEAAGRTDHAVGGYEPAEQILSDILRSAMEVTGAAQGFILVSRESSVLEVAGARNVRPSEVVDVVLARAASPVHSALREGRPAAADERGRPLPIFDGYFEANSPAVLCVPLDLGLRQSGALCLLRNPNARKLSELDLEIVQALSEQAALAIGAACNHTALARLEASLSALVPAHA